MNSIMKNRIVIIFVLIFIFFSIIQITQAEEKKWEDIKMGERIGGYIEKPTPKEALTEEDIETWEKWQRGELMRRPEEIETLEERFKVLLEKWREKIFPDIYIVSRVKGEVLINLKDAKVNDRISIRKDQIILRGYSELEIIDEKTKKIKIIIKQNTYQRTRFYLADMNVPIKSMEVYYDTEAKMTIVEVELQQLTFDVVVYEGIVHTVIDMPVSMVPIITTIPETPPPPPEEPIHS